MGVIRNKLVRAVINKAYLLIDHNIHNNIDKQYEFRKQIVLDDQSLTNDEKLEAIKILTIDYDYNKVFFNQGTKRLCENCHKTCLATLYCEHCIRYYLEANFLNWTSGNLNIDNLIQRCQMDSYTPSKIIEWIPYNNLQNIEYLTQGGFSEIYSAEWINGGYFEWNPKEKKLKRFGTEKVILKTLKNVESANRSWFDEVQYAI